MIQFFSICVQRVIKGYRPGVDEQCSGSIAIWTFAVVNFVRSAIASVNAALTLAPLTKDQSSIHKGDDDMNFCDCKRSE